MNLAHVSRTQIKKEGYMEGRVGGKDVRREDDNWKLVNIGGRRNVNLGEGVSFHKTDAGGGSGAETGTRLRASWRLNRWRLIELN